MKKTALYRKRAWSAQLCLQHIVDQTWMIQSVLDFPSTLRTKTTKPTTLYALLFSKKDKYTIAKFQLLLLHIHVQAPTLSDGIQIHQPLDSMRVPHFHCRRQLLHRHWHGHLGRFRTLAVAWFWRFRGFRWFWCWWPWCRWPWWWPWWWLLQFPGLLLSGHSSVYWDFSRTISMDVMTQERFMLRRHVPSTSEMVVRCFLWLCNNH